MVKNNTTVVVDNMPRVVAAMKALTEQAVYVGIPSTKAKRTTDPLNDGEPKKGAPINNAALGYLHDHGVPEKNIPARPWLLPGVATSFSKVSSLFRKAGSNALSGDLSAVLSGFNAAGLVAQVAIKAYITKGIPPALSPKTIAARKARGVTRTTPLIDTAKMLNAVSYVIRKK